MLSIDAGAIRQEQIGRECMRERAGPDHDDPDHDDIVFGHPDWSR